LKHYLVRAKGNISMAASFAKIPRQSFHRLMKKHGIKNPRPSN
jgi:transcriptional regulator of acetoin/glycerol metabolism